MNVRKFRALQPKTDSDVLILIATVGQTKVMPLLTMPANMLTTTQTDTAILLKETLQMTALVCLAFHRKLDWAVQTLTAMAGTITLTNSPKMSCSGRMLMVMDTQTKPAQISQTIVLMCPVLRRSIELAASTVMLTVGRTRLMHTQWTQTDT
jgi:hypothetical protein